MPTVEQELVDLKRRIEEMERGIGRSGISSVGHGRTHGLEDHIPRNNHSATAAPTTGDDSADGYGVSSLWVDTNNDKAYVCLDATAGAAVWTEITTTMKAPYVITPASLFSIGAEMAAHAFAAPASATWPTSNKALYVPFWLPESVTLTQLFWHNGATVSGNVDAAVYAEDGTRKISAGSTAQSGTNAIQSADVADTALTAGRYYLALAMDNTTGTILFWTSTVALSKSFGLAEQTSAFALPATATLATITTTRLPLVGMTIRTIV